MITTEQIKELRDKTGVSIMQCRKALETAGGDMEKALLELRAASAEIAEKKADRELKAGLVQSYVHSSGTMGALVEVNCETDFVAKNPEFKVLAADIAMQVAACAPESVEALLEQPFVKDGEMNVSQLLKNFTQKFGENVGIGSFKRISVLGN